MRIESQLIFRLLAACLWYLSLKQHKVRRPVAYFIITMRLLSFLEDNNKLPWTIFNFIINNDRHVTVVIPQQQILALDLVEVERTGPTVPLLVDDDCHADLVLQFAVGPVPLHDVFLVQAHARFGVAVAVLRHFDQSALYFADDVVCRVYLHYFGLD